MIEGVAREAEQVEIHRLRPFSSSKKYRTTSNKVETIGSAETSCIPGGARAVAVHTHAFLQSLLICLHSEATLQSRDGVSRVNISPHEEAKDQLVFEVHIEQKHLISLDSVIACCLEYVPRIFVSGV